MPKASIDLDAWQLKFSPSGVAEKRRLGCFASITRSSFSRHLSGKKIDRQGVKSP
jgi:hypothetical protein